jgi:peptide/nickel transport system permease protein
VSIRAVLTRISLALATLLFVVCFNFFLFHAVGDAKQDLARNPRLDQAAQLATIKERGLDKPLLSQFGTYLSQTARGDFGDSFVSHRPVIEELGHALPNTLILIGFATLIASLLGPMVGLAAAWRRGRWRDSALTQGSVALYSMPEFWLGMVLISLFATRFPIFPAGLQVEPGSTTTGLAHAFEVAKHAVLPVATLTLSLLAQYAVVMRASATDAMREDFVTTGRAIGLTPRQIRRRHVIPNARLPVVTVIGLNFGFVLGGAITIEALFSWPGIGQLTVEAIENKDYPVLQGVFLVSATGVILMNLIVDLLYTKLDPRVQLD